MVYIAYPIIMNYNLYNIELLIVLLINACTDIFNLTLIKGQVLKIIS